MKTKALTAAQIDTLAQRLSETSIKSATSAKKAGDNFARLLAARIGTERAALAFTSIMTADTADKAEARLTLVLDYGTTDSAGETIRAAEKEAKAAPTPVVGRRQAIVDLAQSGTLPTAPDFSKPTHARFRAKLAQIVALAEAGDIAALQAFEINPVSSSPKAMARWMPYSRQTRCLQPILAGNEKRRWRATEMHGLPNGRRPGGLSQVRARHPICQMTAVVIDLGETS
jgi:hypothetical protein